MKRAFVATATAATRIRTPTVVGSVPSLSSFRGISSIATSRNSATSTNNGANNTTSINTSDRSTSNASNINNKMTVIDVQIISDTSCPWCYVGKKRLEKGIAQYKALHPERESDEFNINWMPYQLNPAFKESVEKYPYWVSRYGQARTDAIFERLSSIGREEGINFKFGGKTGNTRDSHRLIQLAKTISPEMQTKVVERLFEAYFENEEDIASHQTLLAAGVKAGMDKQELEKFLKSDEQGPLVDKEVRLAKMNAVSGVPYYVIQDNLQLSGAQDPEDFVQAFERAFKMQEKNGN